jgi:SAM-dependent MidA family methyltransferase
VNSRKSQSQKPFQAWPEPDEGALKTSRELVNRIIQEIQANHGCISFERFMDMALYEPGLGYYSAGNRKLGAAGDFTTAPELSMLFSACLARQCQQIFEITGFRHILELGAGSGQMACDILAELQRTGQLPESYTILETSADLRQRQQHILGLRHPDFMSNIHWLDTLPEGSFEGVILGNEVLDAIPVHRFCIRDDGMREIMVGHDGKQFIWLDDIDGVTITQQAQSRFSELLASLPEGYTSEYSQMIPPFMGSLSDTLNKGAILFVDYGYSRREYYHPQRLDGTLVCHYRHRSHDDPFLHVGYQDISAFVDFTLVAESAHQAGLDVHGYTTQVQFLMSLGIDQIMLEQAGDDDMARLRLSQQASHLLLPGEMGEKFKVMALTKDITGMLEGFRLNNQIHRL